MATTITAYDHLWKLTKIGAVDLDTDTLRLALVTNAYTPSTAHTQWSDVSTYEVATGSGYTTNGEAIATPVVTNTSIDYDDVQWLSLIKTFFYAVCYKDGSGGGLTNPLLFYIIPDTTGDIVSAGSNYTIQWNSVNHLFYKP